jgi:uncharacterized protein
MPEERSREGMLSPVIKAVKNYPLASFFVLTFTISWTMWLSVWMTGKGVVLYTYPLLFIGVFGPFISAFTMTYLQSGRVGVRMLARRLLQWRESLRWYAVSLFLIPAMMLVAIGLNVAIGGQVGHSSWLQWWLPMILPLALVTGIITGGPLAEEPGWRGFALPRLQAKFGPLAGGLALGLIWCCWHIPLFFIKGSSQYGLPFALWAVYTMSLSLLMVWVYNRSNGSILIMMLFHASSNIAITVLPVLPQMAGGWNTAYIYMAIVILVMIAIILWNWRDMTVKKPIESRNSA